MILEIIVKGYHKFCVAMVENTTLHLPQYTSHTLVQTVSCGYI